MNRGQGTKLTAGVQLRIVGLSHLGLGSANNSGLCRLGNRYILSISHNLGGEMISEPNFEPRISSHDSMRTPGKCGYAISLLALFGKTLIDKNMIL